MLQKLFSIEVWIEKSGISTQKMMQILTKHDVIVYGDSVAENKLQNNLLNKKKYL